VTRVDAVPLFAKLAAEKLLLDARFDDQTERNQGGTTGAG